YIAAHHHYQPRAGSLLVWHRGTRLESINSQLRVAREGFGVCISSAIRVRRGVDRLSGERPRAGLSYTRRLPDPENQDGCVTHSADERRSDHSYLNESIGSRLAALKAG